MRDYQNVRIEFHILQSFPVTCLNRDDVGSPKTAIVGGVERGRVSSQCWKRQVRMQLNALGVQIAVRTKRIQDMIEAKCNSVQSKERDSFIAKVIKVFQSKDTVFFLSEKTAEGLAAYVDSLSSYDLKDKEIEKAVKKIFKEDSLIGEKDLSGLDIALFGRMAANATELNVEAASSFSHAITTHKVSSEVDFYTAVDDFVSDSEDLSGAGHLGSSEYNSGTYYRYISLDLSKLSAYFENDEDVEKAVGAFTKALYLAVPSARQKTFAGYCLWDYARVLVRKGQPIQVSFEKPVKAAGAGYLEPSIEALDTLLDRNKGLLGSLYGLISDYKFGLDTNYSIDDLCYDLRKTMESLPEGN